MAELDTLRRDALADRKAFVGKRVVGDTHYAAFLEEAYMSAPEGIIRASQSQIKYLSFEKEVITLRAKMMADGTVADTPDTAESDPFAFIGCISAEVMDLQRDVVKAAGIRDDIFKNNSPVLLSHNADRLPVARSSKFWVSGTSTLAIGRFPKRGVSPDSDQAAALVKAGMLKGLSIGFVPLKYSMSKDPARPLGIDFHEILLLEYSLCALPCCPPCLVIGPVGNKSLDAAFVNKPAVKSSDDERRALRIAEAAAIGRVASWRTRS